MDNLFYSRNEEDEDVRREVAENIKTPLETLTLLELG